MPSESPDEIDLYVNQNLSVPGTVAQATAQMMKREDTLRDRDTHTFRNDYRHGYKLGKVVNLYSVSQF